MTSSIACVCGYRGPAVDGGGVAVCPICRAEASNVGTPPVAAPSLPDELPARAAVVPRAADGRKVYHIPCPKGHVLTAREEMLGRQVVCPECNEFFMLLAESSREHQQALEHRRRQAEAVAAARWLRRAIWAAVFVVLSFVVMAVINLGFVQHQPAP